MDTIDKEVIYLASRVESKRADVHEMYSLLANECTVVANSSNVSMEIEKICKYLVLSFEYLKATTNKKINSSKGAKLHRRKSSAHEKKPQMVMKNGKASRNSKEPRK